MYRRIKWVALILEIYARIRELVLSEGKEEKAVYMQGFHVPVTERKKARRSRWRRLFLEKKRKVLWLKDQLPSTLDHMTRAFRKLKPYPDRKLVPIQTHATESRLEKF